MKHQVHSKCVKYKEFDLAFMEIPYIYVNNIGDHVSSSARYKWDLTIFALHFTRFVDLFLEFISQCRSVWSIIKVQFWVSNIRARFYCVYLCET